MECNSFCGDSITSPKAVCSWRSSAPRKALDFGASNSTALQFAPDSCSAGPAIKCPNCCVN